jgi:hypothetical protein
MEQRVNWVIPHWQNVMFEDKPLSELKKEFKQKFLMLVNLTFDGDGHLYGDVVEGVVCGMPAPLVKASNNS